MLTDELAIILSFCHLLGNPLYTSNNPVKAANITGHKEIGMFLQSMVFLDIKDEPTG
jgi:hypothetical protein